MKRSEAIKLMVAFEEGAFKRFGYNLSRAEVMDGILLQLEKAGMLPPERSEESYRVNKQGRLVDISNSWEPEDETSKQNKLKPTPLTDEELADVIANDEDLQNET